MPEFSHLLAPGRIGTLELKNRLIQTAMGTNLANEDGTASDEIIAFYAARASGGAALLTMGAVGVGYPRGQVQSGQVAISDDRFIPGLKRLTKAVHRNGGRVSAQLHHGGNSSGFDMVAGRPIPLPSMPLPGGDVSGMKNYLLPEEVVTMPHWNAQVMPQFKEADEEDIAQIIQDFVDGAARAVEAGYDAIEVHGAHTYIINSFLSPAENRRTDGYGGSPENRARLLKEVLEAIRARIGPHFPMLVKLNAVEVHTKNGITLDDSRVAARIAEAAGADAITASMQHDFAVTRNMFSSCLSIDEGRMLPGAAALKQAINIPVVVAGRIPAQMGEEAIADGRIDFMATGRKQIADDAYITRLAAGGAKAPRPCIYCYTCISQAMIFQPLRCAVNGDVGYEKDNLLAPTGNPRKVVVVGGGPGGMEAARRLKLRGHAVTLLEASNHLGGTARVAAIAYAPNGEFVEWLKDRLVELRIDVRLGTRATVDLIRKLEPDVVVVATGAVRRAPDIPGKDLPHVHDGASLRALLLGEEEEGVATKGSLVQRVTVGAARTLGLTNNPEVVRKASRLWMPVGDRVVVIGGDLVGLELAEFLRERGREVVVVDEAEKFGRGLSPARRAVLQEELQYHGVALHRGASGIVIGEKAVRFTTADGVVVEAPAETVIIAKGAEPNTGLHDELVAAGIEAHMVGDCSGVGYIQGAVREASDLAARI